MTCFNGFQSMNNYFMEYDNRDKQIHEREKEISEQLKVLEIERNKMESKFNEMTKVNNEEFQNKKKSMIEKIKEKEFELIQNIEEKSIELELENTGKIQCNGHTHRTVKNYHKCLTKNKKQYTQVTQLVYFMDIDDETFDDKLKEFFNLFPEKMKKKIDPRIRYKRYKSYYEKIKAIEEMVSTKVEKYEKILQIIREKYNIEDSDFNDSDEEVDNEQIDNSDEEVDNEEVDDSDEEPETDDDSNDSELNDMKKMTIMSNKLNKIKVCKKTSTKTQIEESDNDSDGELVYNIK